MIELEIAVQSLADNKVDFVIVGGVAIKFIPQDMLRSIWIFVTPELKRI